MSFNSMTYRRDDIKHNLSKASFNPLDVMVTGVTGAGKSTTLNSLFNKEVAEVGRGTEPMTMSLDSYSMHGEMRFWDTPGLGDGKQKDEQHEQNITDLLYKTYQLDNQTFGWIDLAVIVIEGSNRDMGTTFHLLKNVILPSIQSDRVIIAINQADLAMKGRNWVNQFTTALVTRMIPGCNCPTTYPSCSITSSSMCRVKSV